MRVKIQTASILNIKFDQTELHCMAASELQSLQCKGNLFSLPFLSLGVKPASQSELQFSIFPGFTFFTAHTELSPCQGRR